LGTPFHDNQCCHGAGVDCAHLVHAAYCEAGVMGDQGIERYSEQHMLHRDQELFLGYVMRAGAREISPAEALPGDLVLYKIGRVYAHGAIVVEWPLRVIHAHKQSGSVLETGPFDCGLGRGGEPRVFSFW
jgi:cell wall-associated NlpC family hydrolase